MKRFQPVRGCSYNTRNGTEYRCDGVMPSKHINQPAWDARFVSVKTGWIFLACGLWLHEDDLTVEWDYSSGGHFQGEIP